MMPGFGFGYDGGLGIVEGNPDIDRVIVMTGRQSFRLALRLFKRYDLAVSTQVGDRPTLLLLSTASTQ